MIGGARILHHTVDGLFQGRVGADLALTIACLAAILLGESTTAALVVLVALVGESLEGYTVDRASRVIRRLGRLAPTSYMWYAREKRWMSRRMPSWKGTRSLCVPGTNPGRRYDRRGQFGH